MRAIVGLMFALVLTGCSTWVRIENARDIPDGHAVRLGRGASSVVSHVTSCDREGISVAGPGCVCGSVCTVNLLRTRVYVHESNIDPGIAVTIGVIGGLLALGCYVLWLDVLSKPPFAH